MASTSTSQDVSQEVLLKRIIKAEEYKAAGNELYKSKDIRGAIGKYHRAMLYIRDLDSNLQNNILQYLTSFAGQENPPGQLSGLNPQMKLPQEFGKRINDVQQGCLNNLAACILLKDEPDYEKVVTYCDKVLAINPRNAKALYRKGCALYHLGAHEAAYQSLIKAQQISKSDPNIRKYLALAKDKMSDENNAQRLMYQGMFNKSSTETNS
ncbi:tetratricopeptide repeat protein 9C-like [Asterias amurensis]|uniref:tetratricopeptide repeat protein 9C-like n=1 Tax=Asterias amurensis TaxID=7602 RepID=UPI003AB45CE5